MTVTEAPPAASRAGLGNRLYNGETRIDFIGRQRRGLLLSGVLIGLGLVAILLQGLNFGIEFRGGTSWDVPADVSVGRVNTVMGEAGFPNAKVQRFTPASGDPFVRASAKVEGKDAAARETESLKVRDKLATLTAGKPVSTTVVGPSWGNEITKKARNALIVFFLVIASYLAIRFEWRMAVAALAAVVHDILVTIGIYALSGLEVTPASVIAFLTILGYSLYDTVVVFDRVDENAKALASTGRATYSDVVNLSMNQTLMRSLNTSLVAILPILSVLVIGTFVLGATTLRDFGMALFIGLVTGAYSSIFIASPLLAWLKEREPRYRQLRARLEQRGGTAVGLLSPAGAARAGLAGSGGGKAKPVPARLGGGAAATAKAKRASGSGATATKARSGSTTVLRPGAPASHIAAPEVDAAALVDGPAPSPAEPDEATPSGAKP
ncbi:MAG: protein translocase subunit SecF, partial [Acidimicrobiales bacterium]